MPQTLKRCPLCGHDAIRTDTRGHVVTVDCPGCGAVVEVELDPEDDPDIRGRISVVRSPLPARTAPTPKPAGCISASPFSETRLGRNEGS
jgi:uncharacterized Zn finger protein